MINYKTYKQRYDLFISICLGIALIFLIFLVYWLPETDQYNLTLPLVIISILFTLFWCLPLSLSKQNGKIDIFHPSILLILIYFIYFMFSGIWLWLYHHYDSIWINIGNKPAFAVNSIFSLGVVSIFAFGLGMRTKPFYLKKHFHNIANSSNIINKKNLKYLFIFFLIIGGLFKIYHLSLLGPLTFNILNYLSPSANYDLGLYLSLFFVMLESMVDWAALLAIFYFVVNIKKNSVKNRWWLLLIFVSLIAMFDYILSAKRSGIIPFLLLPIIWYHYIIKRLSFRRAGILFLVTILFISALLVARTVLPLLVENLTPSRYIGNNPSKIMAYFIDSGEFSTFDMIIASVYQRDALLTQAGGPVTGFLKYSFSTMIFIIPRIIWPGKPTYEDLSHVYYRFLIDSNGYGGIAPTVWGSSYLIASLLGLILAMFVLGWFFNNMYVYLQPQKNNLRNVLLYSIFYWMAFQFIRFGTTGFVLLMFVTSMVWGVISAFIIWRKRETIHYYGSNV